MGRGTGRSENRGTNGQNVKYIKNKNKTKKENEKNVEWFLQQHKDFELELPLLPITTMMETQQKTITLYPHIHHTDGFFIARFRRKE